MVYPVLKRNDSIGPENPTTIEKTATAWSLTIGKHQESRAKTTDMILGHITNRGVEVLGEYTTTIKRRCH